MNAYQQQHPHWPVLTQTKLSVSSVQCQTDSLIFASLTDNSETRQKLQAALEQLGDNTEDEAETIAAEQRETALKMFAEQEAAKADGKQATTQISRPLHLPRGNFDRTQKSNVSKEQREAIQKIKEHVVQRDSVARLREMLNHSRDEATGAHTGKQFEEMAHASSKKLPKRVFNSLREPPRILAETSESLISLAAKLRHLDVTTEERGYEDDSLYLAQDVVRTSLHQRLAQLPVPATTEHDHAAAIGTTYSLSYSLQSRQRNSGGM